MKQRALQALLEVGLAGAARQTVKSLSQGQKRRVALCRLLLCPAKLWVLDEPLTALDQASVQRLLLLMHQHLAQNGLIVLTSHQEIESSALPSAAPTASSTHWQRLELLP